MDMPFLICTTNKTYSRQIALITDKRREPMLPSVKSIELTLRWVPLINSVKDSVALLDITWIFSIRESHKSPISMTTSRLIGRPQRKHISENGSFIYNDNLQLFCYIWL